MSDKSDSEQIDDIIAQQSGWKQEVLVALRAAIRAADPAAVEVVKYKKPSKPEGVPFWTHDGDVCFVDVLKSAVRLTFARGARMERSDLFNTRLDSKVVRAIDYFEGDRVDEAVSKFINLLKNAIKDAKAKHGTGKRGAAWPLSLSKVLRLR